MHTHTHTVQPPTQTHTRRDFQYIIIINDEQCGMPATNLKRAEHTARAPHEERAKTVREGKRERERGRARDESVNTVNI